MVTLEYAEFLAGQANAYIRVVGNRLMLYRAGTFLGSTLIDGTGDLRAVSEHAVKLILAP